MYHYHNTNKGIPDSIKVRIPFLGLNLVELFLFPWVINKAMAALIGVNITLPTFTYWQMFFILWGIRYVCSLLGKIFHKS